MKSPKRPLPPPVRIFASGREVCDLTRKAGLDEYMRRKRLMWDRQEGLCCICKKWLPWHSSAFEHENGRGFGGSKRDDRIEVDGKPRNGVAHVWCNSLKGSKPGTYNQEQFHSDFAGEVIP